MVQHADKIVVARVQNVSVNAERASVRMTVMRALFGVGLFVGDTFKMDVDTQSIVHGYPFNAEQYAIALLHTQADGSLQPVDASYPLLSANADSPSHSTSTTPLVRVANELLSVLENPPVPLPALVARSAQTSEYHREQVRLEALRELRSIPRFINGNAFARIDWLRRQKCRDVGYRRSAALR